MSTRLHLHRALLWLHLKNNSRRWAATYVMPLLCLAFLLLYAIVLHDQKYRRGDSLEFSEELKQCGISTRYSRCYSELDIRRRNSSDGPTIVKSIPSQDLMVLNPAQLFKLQPTIKNAPDVFGTDNFDCVRKHLDLLSVGCEQIFTQGISAAYITDYTLILVVFYCLVLSELREEQIRRVPLFMSYLGVSKLNFLVSWLITHCFLSIIWASISCAPYFYHFPRLSSSLVLIWPFVFVNFITIALFALLCSKFIKGSIWFLLFVLQMLTVYMVVFIMSLSEEGLLSIRSPFRFLFLLHPVVYSINFRMLLQQAEYSKVGLTLSSLDSYFHDDILVYRYFGTVSTMFLLMIIMWVVFCAVYCLDFELRARILNYFRSRKHRVDINVDSSVTEGIPYEETPNEPVLVLKQVSKIYSTASMPAVDKLSLKVGSGEILGLLGKNGAGKSTTMNMVAGFTSITWGEVSVLGFDGVKQSVCMNRMLSFCPQENLFLLRLSVLEHLKFVCLLKGASIYSQEKAVGMLRDLNLDSKKNSKPACLSGGEKRRLCVAMAYIAGSPLVMLDEPTSGVDPATRKLLWSFIQKYQKEPIHVPGRDNVTKRAVVLSTHFMEEADCLSERIAIIANGQLKVLLSPFSLKSQFGIGERIKCATDKRTVQQILSKQTDLDLVEIEQSGEEVILSFNAYSSHEKAEKVIKVLEVLQARNINHTMEASSLEQVFIKLTSSVSYPKESSKQSLNEHGQSESSISHLPGEVGFSNPVESDIREDKQSKIPALTRQKGNIVFCLYVDGFLLFRNSWKFFFVFTLLFILVPWTCMLMAYPSEEFSDLSTKNQTFEIELDTEIANPKVLLISVELSDVEAFKLVFPNVDIELANDTRDLYERFYNYPFSVYGSYPFFIRYIAESDRFNCILNMNFAASFDICVVALNNFYHFRDQSKQLYNLEVDYHIEDDKNEEVFQDIDVSRITISILKGQIYSVVMPVMLSCLIFYLLRLEQRSVSRRELEYYRANGRSVLWSLSVRLISLAVPILIFSQSAMIFARIEDLLSSDGQKQLLPLTVPVILALTLFSFAGAAFVILYVRLTTSLFALLVPTVLFAFLFVPLLYNEVDLTATKEKKYIWSVFAFAYAVPVPLLGCVFNWNRNEIAFKTWTLQVVAYLCIIVFATLLWYRRSKYYFRRLFKRTPNQEATQQSLLRVDNLKHTYKSHKFNFGCHLKLIGVSKTKAVQNMSFDVGTSQCFALLGVNGSGKSTTFEAITGGLGIQNGNVALDGVNVSRNPLKAFESLGYCPQFDTVPAYLTVDQLLDAFAVLRCVPKGERDRQKQFFVNQLELGKDLGKLVSQCSGGTKRKVCTALAFVGYPPVVVLDESTTGMDPVIRKNVSSLIQAAKKRGSAVVVSSHTMEEVESVADVICIMAKGNKRAEGSQAELRERYGQFLTLNMKLKLSHSDSEIGSDHTDGVDESAVVNARSPEVNLGEREEVIRRELSQCCKQVELSHSFVLGSSQQLVFNIGSKDCKLSEVLRLIEEKSRDWSVEERMISGCTLESIFMQIALESEYNDDATSKETGQLDRHVNESAV